MSKPLSLNLRVGTEQAGLLGEDFDGDVYESRDTRRSPVKAPPGLSLFDDRRTAVNCVPITVELDDTQGDLFDA